ncbi:MAG: sulfurtransferase, partial [Defluviimonas sp.]|nr:sulfurtransferase [Defluviimonas sp.]
MRTFALSTLLASGLLAGAAAAEIGPLVAPAELQELIGGAEAPLVLDIRGATYDQG